MIIACYIFRYSPTGIRATVALLHQIDKSLEEASESLGASSFTTFRRITLPLIMPAFFSGSAWFHPLDDGDQRHHLPHFNQLDAGDGAHSGEHDRARSGRRPRSQCS